MKKLWGSHRDGDAFLYKLGNGEVDVEISNFGAIIHSINLPDRSGARRNIVLAYASFEEYLQDEYYLGCVVGRVTGRTSGAGFTIDNQRYQLSVNSGESVHLHGGYAGFGKKLFRTLDYSSSMIRLHCFSPHLEEGYPGNLDLWITYELTQFSELIISYRTISDRDTHVNLTNHTYFNLNGDENINHHQIRIDADAIVASDNYFIPSGKLLPVKHTRFDFNQVRQIGNEVANDCFVLKEGGGGLLLDSAGGRFVDVSTDCPGILLYTGDYLGNPFSKRQGICFETQFFPDSANQQAFPSTLLRAGEEWNKQTRFRLGVAW